MIEAMDATTNPTPPADDASTTEMPEGLTVERGALIQRMVFRVFPEPTVDALGAEHPPHWAIVDAETEAPHSWGPIETVQAAGRMYGLATIASRHIPADVLALELHQMGLGPAPSPSTQRGAQLSRFPGSDKVIILPNGRAVLPDGRMV